METPPRSGQPMDAYLQRYERQQRERRRQRLQQRAQNPEVAEEDLSGFLSDFRQELEGRRLSDVLSEREEDAVAVSEPQAPDYAAWGGDAVDSEGMGSEIDLVPLPGFPGDPFRSAGVAGGDSRNAGHTDDEFVDAATYLAENELDSFAKRHESAGYDWQNEHESGRASDFFKRKSRSLDHVEFSSSERYDEQDRVEPNNQSQAIDTQEDQVEENQASIGDRAHLASTAYFSESQGTAISSSNDVHFDANRLAYTPNSLKHLQEKHRFRQATTIRQPSESGDSIGDYTGEAQRITASTSFARVETENVDGSDTTSERTMSALQRGPTVIRSALDEIDALLNRSRRRSSPRPKERGSNAMTPRDFQELVREYDLAQDTGLPMSRTTDSWDDEFSDDVGRPVGNPNSDTRMDCPDPVARELDTIRELPNSLDDVASAPDSHSVHYDIQDEAYYSPHSQEQPEGDDGTDGELVDRVSDLQLTPRKPVRPPPPQASLSSEVGADKRAGGISSEPKNAIDAREKARVAMDPVQISRRCRRLLCDVGDVVTEQIIFSNSTSTMGRLCVSLLPLTVGCQQFSVSPAVLELSPQCSGAFHVTFNAQRGGVAAGIFQFRGVGIKSLLRPYEVLMEASVRRVYELEDRTSEGGGRAGEKRRNHSNSSSRHVEELRDSVSLKDVDIGPTFIQFEKEAGARSERAVQPCKVRMVNNTAEALLFKVKCAYENLKVSPTSGMLPPASEAFVTVVPISQPFLQARNADSTASMRPASDDKWCGSLSVQVGKQHAREVSVVVSAALLALLPPFDEVARSRHGLSSQTDSFYYSKRRNRRGLYFHARAVECGDCMVGDWHEVPVYVCNGSSRPVTVFLQELQAPFSCAYATTTIQPRKFIELTVRFSPKVVGKVATSLFAYSVDEKAVVTLVARGV